MVGVVPLALQLHGACTEGRSQNRGRSTRSYAGRELNVYTHTSVESDPMRSTRLNRHLVNRAKSEWAALGCTKIR
jgi:hypothetical protein